MIRDKKKHGENHKKIPFGKSFKKISYFLIFFKFSIDFLKK